MAGVALLSLANGQTVECVYWTEPKATCRQCKNQPNAYNMYTDLEGILSACLHLYVSFYFGMVHFCRYVFLLINAFTTVEKVDKRYDNLLLLLLKLFTLLSI
jgi:hypothetical protein